MIKQNTTFISIDYIVILLIAQIKINAINTHTNRQMCAHKKMCTTSRQLVNLCALPLRF